MTQPTAPNPPRNNQSQSAPKFKRRKTLILPRLQLSLIMAALIVFIIAAGIFFGTISIVFLKLQQIAINTGLEANHALFLELKSLENITATVYGLTVVVAIFILFVGGLRLSHRVAGPIYVLNRQIVRFINRENPPDLRFRKDDFMDDLQDNFNRLMSDYKKLQEESASRNNQEQ